MEFESCQNNPRHWQSAILSIHLQSFNYFSELVREWALLIFSESHSPYRYTIETRQLKHYVFVAIIKLSSLTLDLSFCDGLVHAVSTETYPHEFDSSDNSYSFWSISNYEVNRDAILRLSPHHMPPGSECGARSPVRSRNRVQLHPRLGARWQC